MIDWLIELIDWLIDRNITRVWSYSILITVILFILLNILYILGLVEWFFFHDDHASQDNEPISYLIHQYTINCSLNKLQSVQNNACRTILLVNWFKSTDDVHTELKLPRLDQRWNVHMAVQCHNIYFKDRPVLHTLYTFVRFSKLSHLKESYHLVLIVYLKIIFEDGKFRCLCILAVYIIMNISDV